MLIKRAADTYEKIQALGGMASDDILSRPGQAGDVGGTRRDRGPYSAPRNNLAAGVYRSALPNGKYVNLMRVMFTDFCKMDCAFCPNSHWVPRRRFAFKVDELANAFMEMYRRHTVAGLFLSSGVAGSGFKTTEKMTKVVDLIRNKARVPGLRPHEGDAGHGGGVRRRRPTGWGRACRSTWRRRTRS